MAKTIFVGNVPWNTSEEEVRKLFGRFGAVGKVNLVSDRYTGMSRGFAFVTMEDQDAGRAIAELNGVDLGGRRLRVEEARQSRTGRARDQERRRRKRTWW